MNYHSTPDLQMRFFMSNTQTNSAPAKKSSKKAVWIVLILLLLALLAVGAVLLYQSLFLKVKKDGVVYLRVEEEYHVVSHYDAAMYPELTVLDTLNDLTVTTVAAGAFENNTALTKISLPASIKTIEARAFKHCQALTTVTIAATSMQRIDTEAFYGCTALTAITLPSELGAFGASVFHNCTVLPEVTLPKNLTELPEKLFCNCELLGSIELPETLTKIGAQAFLDCNILNKITVPASLKEIGSSAFEGCHMLSEVHTSSLADWCGITFANANANPLSQTKSLYIDNVLVTNITFPEGVTEIKSFAFYSFKGLESVTFPEGLTRIGESAFEKCVALTTVTLSPTVSFIDKNAFNSCSMIGRVNISCLTAWCGITFASPFSNPLYFSQILHVNGTPITDLVIPLDVQTISAYAFYNYDMLKSVQFHNNLEVIGDAAFYNCNLLMSITLPAGITAIGTDAFFGCYKLIEIYNLSNLNLKKGANANGGVALYALNIYTDPATPSKTFVDENGFRFYENGSECYLINYEGTNATATLPADCHGKKYKIYNYAFYENEVVTKVIISAGVGEIGASAFEACINLTEVEIGSEVHTINQHAFYHCDKLKKATFKVRSGWRVYVYETSRYVSNLSRADIAATYLRETYIYYQWRRG